jgi:hypothetical protein
MQSCLNALETAIHSLKLTPLRYELACLEKIRTLRLSGRSEAAIEFMKTLPSSFSQSAQRELEWERRILEGGPKKIEWLLHAAATTHADSTYALDAYFWARSGQCRDWGRALPRNFEGTSRFAKFARLFEKLYDTGLSVSNRIEMLGRELERIKEVSSIEKELLVWAASARWLFRIKASGLAGVALDEYSALSLRVSRGRNPDVLGVAADLLER